MLVILLAVVRVELFACPRVNFLFLALIGGSILANLLGGIMVNASVPIEAAVQLGQVRGSAIKL